MKNDLVNAIDTAAEEIRAVDNRGGLGLDVHPCLRTALACLNKAKALAAEPERADVATLERVRERLRGLYDETSPHNATASRMLFVIDDMLTEARAQPPAPRRCDECDWTFGCFNGSAPCRKVPLPAPRVDLDNGLLYRERAEQAKVHTQPASLGLMLTEARIKASVHELVLQLVKEVVVTAAERTFRNGGLDAAAFRRFAHDVTEVCDKKLVKP